MVATYNQLLFHLVQISDPRVDVGGKQRYHWITFCLRITELQSFYRYHIPSIHQTGNRTLHKNVQQTGQKFVQYKRDENSC